MLDRSRARKAQLTHGLLFFITGNNVSINKHLKLGHYPKLIYGWCLKQIIHFIVALFLDNPIKTIFIVKYDLVDAYQRLSHNGEVSNNSTLIHKNIAYMFLWLIIGGSSNLSAWCSLLETIIDFSSNIFLFEWNHMTEINPKTS